MVATEASSGTDEQPPTQKTTDPMVAVPWSLPEGFWADSKVLGLLYIQAGMHFYLLYEDSPLQEPGTDDSPQKFMDGIPAEFHPVTFLFDRLVLLCIQILNHTPF